MHMRLAVKAFPKRQKARPCYVGISVFIRQLICPSTLPLSSCSPANSSCLLRLHKGRKTSYEARAFAQQHVNETTYERLLTDYGESIEFPKATHEICELSSRPLKEGGSRQVVLHGYLGNRADLSKNLSFVPLFSRSLDWTVQVISSSKASSVDVLSAHQKLRKLGPNTPVAVLGCLRSRPTAPADDGPVQRISDVEVELHDVQCLNEFPKDLIGSADDVFGPEDRHLQLRTDKGLRDALGFRAKLVKLCRGELEKQDFLEVETPLLFKSTPEGAREFAVPTRRKGLAYALPQSPQQFKQILMGSGISRYYQIARCFRDEDLRADRQPEFTQLDLEMSFASGSDVMERVTLLIRTLWRDLLSIELPSPFPTITYNTAMTSYGSDKPDLRLATPLHRVEHLLPADLISKLSDLRNPIIEALGLKIQAPEDLHDPPAAIARKFINTFLDSPPAAPFNANPHGAAGIFVYNPLAPLRGLSAFGFEATSAIEDLLSPDEGTLIILQARPNTPLSGGSTAFGNLRSLLLKAAFKQRLLMPEVSYAPLWVTEFPLFTPSEHNPNEGQSSPTGLSSTHHPFTSPLSPHDISLLPHSPEDVLADHYDLVINGVELGGGSRRIHNAAFQKYILKDILQLSEGKLKDFEHLIRVLKAGCPPHAGFALGFDRLAALMMGKESVRDVIAFPKGSGGEDKCVGSPASLGSTELERYGLKLVD